MLSRLLLVVLVCALTHWTDASDGEYLRVPGGKLLHRECVHEVPSGSHIEDRGREGVFIDGRRAPPCHHVVPKENGGQQQAPSLPAEGWQTWTVLEHPQNKTFTTFNGYFTVPDAPSAWGRTAKAAIVYIVSLSSPFLTFLTNYIKFTGLQNENWVPNSQSPSSAPKDFEIIQPVLQYGGGSANGGG